MHFFHFPFALRIRWSSWCRLAPWLGVLILVASAWGIRQSMVLPHKNAILDLQRRIAVQPIVDPIRPEPVASGSHDPISTTLAQFPEVKQAPQVWMKLEDLAAKHQISLGMQTLDWQDESDLPLTHMAFSLSPKVAETDLRQFLLEAKAAIPSLLIPQLNLKRSRSLDRQLDADVQLLVYFRRSL